MRYRRDELDRARRDEQVILEVQFDAEEMLHQCDRCCGEGELICNCCGGTGGEHYLCTLCNGSGVHDCPECRG